MRNIFRHTIYLSAVLLLGATLLGCKDGRDKVLYAPLSHEDVSSIVKIGMTRKALIEICGEPFNVREKGATEELEFMLSFDRVQTSDWIMSSFVVVVSNDTVVSWHPQGKGRVR